MKKLQFIFCLFSLLVFMPACSDDNEDGQTSQSSVISDLTTTDYTLAQDGENPYLFRMNWTKTKFFTESGSPVFVDNIKYEVEADLSENDFANAYTVYSTTSLYFDVYTETLRDIYNHFAETNSGETLSVSLRIKSTGNGLTGYSDPVSLNISPYSPEPELTKVEPGTLQNLPATHFVLQNPGENNPVLFTANWTETLFYFDNSDTPSSMSPLSYVLQIDKDGNNFNSAEILASTSALTAEVYTKDLNTLLLDNFGAVENVAISIELRLLIKYGHGESAGETVSTNTLKISVTPYGEVKPYEPINPVQGMYIIGDLNGWNNSNISTMYPMFKTNQNSDNYVFTFVGYLPVGNFKFLPHESLNSYHAFCLIDGKLQYVVTDGGAFNNAVGGYKSITIDVKNLTYEIKDYNESSATVWNYVDIAGSFNGWGGTPSVMTNLTAQNKHIWVLDLNLPEPDPGETHPMKFRGDGSWDHRWSPNNPEDAMFGTTTYNKIPDDNIVVRQGGNYRVSFNDLTGQYVFIKK